MGPSLIILSLLRACQRVHRVEQSKSQRPRLLQLSREWANTSQQHPAKKKQFSAQVNSSPSYPNTYDSQLWPHLYCLDLKNNPSHVVHEWWGWESVCFVNTPYVSVQ